MHWLSIAVLGGMFVLATALPINMGLIAFVGAFLVGTLVAGMGAKAGAAGYAGGAGYRAMVAITSIRESMAGRAGGRGKLKAGVSASTSVRPGSKAEVTSVGSWSGWAWRGALRREDQAPWATTPANTMPPAMAKPICKLLIVMWLPFRRAQQGVLQTPCPPRRCARRLAPAS